MAVSHMNMVNQIIMVDQVNMVNHQHVFTTKGQAVLAFYTHKVEKLTAFQKRMDTELSVQYGYEVSRLHLSNFYAEEFAVEWDACLLHPFLADRFFAYPEQVFQAAKAKQAMDAEVLLTYNEVQECAEFGRGKLPLDEARVGRFEQCGLPLKLVRCEGDDGKKIIDKMVKEANWKKSENKFLDSAGHELVIRLDESDKKCFVVRPFELREGWQDVVRYQVMSHIQRARFFGPTPQRMARLSFQAYMQEGFFFLEHKDWRTCSIWADGYCDKQKTTKGQNALGKCMNVCHKDEVGSKLPAPTLQWMKENSNVDVDYEAALVPSN